MCSLESFLLSSNATGGAAPTYERRLFCNELQKLISSFLSSHSVTPPPPPPPPRFHNYITSPQGSRH